MPTLSPTLHLHEQDLPAALDLDGDLAIDTETMGLHPTRDRLCLVQISAGDGISHIVRFGPGPIDAPILSRVLGDPQRTKIFHFARFDVGVLQRHLGVIASPLFCTKIASKLARTYTDRHGLKDLCRELLGTELSKQMQSSDWGAPELSEAQLAYAASDVLHLHALRDKLALMLEREGRRELADACFHFLPTRVALDSAGWPDVDLFAY